MIQKQKGILIFAAAILMFFVAIAPFASQAVDPTPTPTSTPTPTVSPTPTPTVSPTPTPTVSPTPTPTPTPTVSPTPTPTPTPVSAYWSTVAASPSVLIADGAQSTITVIVKNSLGAIMADKEVAVYSNRTEDTITPATAKTDANGIAIFKVSSLVAGKSTVTAKVGELKINQTAAVNFLPVGSDIGNPTTPNENSGVILYRIPGDHRVYVIKNKKKHWIKSPKEFEDNGYDWSKIQEASAAILAKYPDAEPLLGELLRAIGDTRVYIVKEGKKRWIKTAEEFNAAGYDWQSIKDTAPATLENYSDSELADVFVKIVNAMVLRVRSANSIRSAILDLVGQNEVYTVIEKKNGWYKIKTKNGKTGWIFGKYAAEE